MELINGSLKKTRRVVPQPKRITWPNVTRHVLIRGDGGVGVADYMLGQWRHTPHLPPGPNSGKRAFGQTSLVPIVIWAGTKVLATSSQIRLTRTTSLVPARYNPLVPV
jgi:hypothetical protein